MSEASPTIAPIEKFLSCVHCGLCLSSCPTYLETGNEADSPRGRIHLMRALEEERLSPTAALVRHLDLCLGCRACETACPSGVEYGTLIEGGRSFVERSAGRSTAGRRWRRALGGILPRPERVRPLRPLFAAARALGVARLAGVAWIPRRLRRLAALVPEAAPERALPPETAAVGAARGTVALLSGCVARVLFPEVHQATIRLLSLAGWRVLVPPEQGCCGALSAHLGDEEESHRLARRNLPVFAPDEIDFVVANAAGCGAHLRAYGRLFADDPVVATPAAALAAKVRDVTEILAEGGLPPPTREVRARVAYHDACHLAHGQGIREAPRALLRRVPGLELVEIAESEICCGSAGTYNLTEPDMAWRLAERKARHVLAAKPEIVTAGNPGCIVQIRAALRFAGHDVPVVHPVELLARAYADAGARDG